MAIGRTFPETLQKACARSSRAASASTATRPRPQLRRRSTTTSCCAGVAIADARPALPARGGAAPRRHRRRASTTPRRIDPWFLDQILLIVEERARAGRAPASTAMTAPDVAAGQAARLRRRPAGLPVGRRRGRRCAPRALAAGVRATFKTVDTCAAEFEAETPYHYSTYEDEDEVAPVDRPKVVILGSGPEPHRPGHRVRLLLRARQLRPARRRLRDDDGQLQPRDGVAPTTTPPTASTSSRSPTRTCSTSSRPSRPPGGSLGVIVSLGGQTPLKLAGAAARGARRSARRRRRSTSPRTASVERAVRPTATSRSRRAARPPTSSRRWRSSSGSASRCWCGRATCSAAGPCRSSTTTTTCAGHGRARRLRLASAREGGLSAERPVLIDRFLEDATEVDVDAIRDAHRRGAHRRRDGARRGGRRALAATRPARSRRRRCRAGSSR